jgi:hypothetical protein
VKLTPRKLLERPFFQLCAHQIDSDVNRSETRVTGNLAR